MATNLKQNADGSVSLVQDIDSVEVMRVGGPPQGNLLAADTASYNFRVPTWIHQKAAVSSATAGTFNITNPFAVTCVIVNALFYLRTGSAVTTTLDIGTGASASATSDNLLDGISIGATSVPAAGVYDINQDGGTNGRSRQLLGPTDRIVGKASATATSFVGDLYVALFPV